MQATQRTTPTRYAERVSYDDGLARQVWDTALHCHVGFTVDGAPRVLPMLQVRIGDVLYLHGSTGSRVGLSGRDGLDVCVTATLLDGFSLGRSQPDHSINYRTVVAYGTAIAIADPAEKRRVMAALVERIHPGRTGLVRAPSGSEVAAVAVLAMPLTEWSVKARSGGPKDDGMDQTLPVWAGVVPLGTTTGIPEPAPGVGSAWPPSLLPPRSPWLLAPSLSGSHVRIAPLALEHAAQMFTALADEEVWRHMTVAQPQSLAEQEDVIRGALTAYHAGTRVPMAQLDAVTGDVIGTTSFYNVDPVSRALAIGFTQVAKPRWRTAVNTEAKLLLMAYAFEELGAVRVEWHTDIRNVRSQTAIERLGATKEGIVRKHRHRVDGSWRDTVQYSLTDDEWPAAKDRLSKRLATTQ